MIDVLYEDNHLLAVNKPAMLPTMGVADDRPSLLSLAKNYIRRKYSKPGNVYLGIISRLDAPVTGVVLLARTSKAAGRLSKQFREREVVKCYWAIVEGCVAPPSGTLSHYMRKDERHRRMHVAREDEAGAQRAELDYRMLGPAYQQGDQSTGGRPRRTRLSPQPNLGNLSVLEVRPLTGRKHQIRVQLAEAGYPIVGDRKYGSCLTFKSGIALHSRRLVVTHPVSRMQIAFEAPVPKSWPRLTGL